MPVIYVVNAVQVVRKKKGGFSVKSVIYDSFDDPSAANQLACEVIEKILKKENYFTEKPSKAKENENEKESSDEPSVWDTRKQEVHDTMRSEEPPAAKYYDMMSFLDWCPEIPELANTKKYDVLVCESELHH